MFDYDTYLPLFRLLFAPTLFLRSTGLSCRFFIVLATMQFEVGEKNLFHKFRSIKFESHMAWVTCNKW